MENSSEKMIPSLNDMIGLPPAASAAELDWASETRFQALLDKAAEGDADAQRELVALRIAYLNWAYAGRQHGLKRTERA